MPIYEYFCFNCKKKFELLRSMSQSEENTVCPVCGADAQRVLSPFCRNSDGESGFTGGSSCSTCSATNCSSCSSK